MEYAEALIRSIERQRNDALNLCAQLMAQNEVLQARLRDTQPMGLPLPPEATETGSSSYPVPTPQQ